MEDKQLIAKLQQMRQIKPDAGWVVLAKNQILAKEKSVNNNSVMTVFQVLADSLFQRKLAYATLMVMVILVGTFGLVQTTVPGDMLFDIKKMTENARGALMSSVDQPKYNLEIANRRLEDLATVIKENKTSNVASAIQEFKNTINEAVRNLPEDANDFKGIAEGVKKIQESKSIVETLGVIMLNESETLNGALAPLVNNEIKVLDALSKSDSLTLAQEIKLVEAKSHYKKGEYTAALEKILLITN